MSYCSGIQKHYSVVWNGEGELMDWKGGQRADLPTEFRVCRFAPNAEEQTWKYATVCMSQPEDEERLELHLLSPVVWAAHTELLFAIAHYHRTGRRLGLGHTVNFGRPWLPGSSCDHGLISLPYLDGPALELLQLAKGTVRFLWLIPVTKYEVEFRKKYGLEALEAKFEEVHFDYLAAGRQSVV